MPSRYFIVLLTILIPLSGFRPQPMSSAFPYAKMGLTDRQAAAHLLSRFTYGATPADIDAAIKMGLENWFNRQLQANAKDEVLGKRLTSFQTLNMSNEEAVEQFVRNGQLLRMAAEDGVISKDSLQKDTNKEAYRKKLQAYAASKGLKPQKELIKEFISHKILRSIYSENQLQEVMTEFWFNHFNVSFTKPQSIPFIPSYERDVIRPNALGSFNTLLLATAKSPAMLMYLDNFSSSGENSKMAARQNQPAKAKRPKGLNENYAREVMELHTLGVDGGYTQQDVTEAARVFTGWTIYPRGESAGAGMIQKALQQKGEANLRAAGFVIEKDFLFTPNRHDDGSKKVLGKTFPAGGGYQEGVELLSMLARHSSTAKFISRKLAIRFASDNPSPELVSKLSDTFLQTDGDISRMLRTLVSSQEFWSPESIRQKIKSPFELTVSALRVLEADVRQPHHLFEWMNRMGQKIYFYQAPTGFPDKGEYWINTGALLNRMNFGLALATGKIPGIKFDVLGLNRNHEPGSANEALEAYANLFLPERELMPTLERLTPLLNDPQLPEKVQAAAATAPAPPEQDDPLDASEGDMHSGITDNNDYRLSQVIGIILGSPEFQRR